MPSKAAVRNVRSRKVASLFSYIGLCLLWAGTVSLSIATNTGVNTSRIKLSPAQLHVLDVGIALPGLLIWLSILFAAISIGHYARVIAGSKESAGFRFLAYGIFALLAGLIAQSYLGGLRQFVSQYASNPQQVKTTFVVLTNYETVISTLITYGLVLRGGQLLLRGIGERLDLGKKLVPVVVAFLAVAVVYVWLIHDNPARQTAVDPGTNPTFGLPFWLTVFTVALPYVVAWFVGTLALIGIHQYSQKAVGIVYKQLFRKLLIGFTLFIVLTILLQLFLQAYQLYANGSLSFVLGIIAVLFLVLTYAFVLVAQGARKLNTVETLPVE